VEAKTLGPDPGDITLLRWAADSGRILVTIDTDFGTLLHARTAAHAGLIRLPDVPAAARIALMAQILLDHSAVELSQSIVTVSGQRIRISRPPSRSN
jgi:predicted nuclease of predicted toxin-antitoxin system